MLERKTKPGNDKNMREMALSVIRYLNKYHMFQDVNIYAGGTHYSDSRHEGQERRTDLVKNTEIWAGERRKDDCPCEYHNPETLTMTFEGPLYHAMNYGLGRGYRAQQELDAIFARYGLYLELGHAWSLTCYPDPDRKAPERKKPVPRTAPETGPAPVACVLSMATNWPKLHIEAWQFPDMESAKAEMRRQLKARVEMDGLGNAEETMSMLESGVGYSNMALSEDKAHIYKDCASTWRCWQITPVMPAQAGREGGT